MGLSMPVRALPHGRASVSGVHLIRRRDRKGALLVVIALILASCGKKQAQAPPPAPPAPKQNIFALLEDPEGKSTAIVVSNAGGTQEIAQVNRAVRVERNDVAPTAPYAIDPPEVRRLFGTALDAMPDKE